MLPAVVAEVLGADEGSLRSVQPPPARRARHHVAVLDRPPEEVVGRQKDEMAAVTSVGGDGVELVRRDVLVVAREDDQAIALRKPCPGDGAAVQICVGEVVDVAVCCDEPADERCS